MGERLLCDGGGAVEELPCLLALRFTAGPDSRPALCVSMVGTAMRRSMTSTGWMVVDASEDPVVDAHIDDGRELVRY
jgi:hypothetical protein